MLNPPSTLHMKKNQITPSPFLDILIIKSQNVLTFKVYYKPTNENDYIHFCSHHNNKIKIGLINGFYQRALRICSPQHLDEEFKYIEHSLKSLKYQKFFILGARKKAHQINLGKQPHYSHYSHTYLPTH